MVSEVIMAGLPTALREGDQDSVQRLIAELNPADIADLIGALSEQALDIPLLMSLDLARRADTFGYLPITAQTDIASRLSTGALSELVTEMPSDERADLVKQLDENVRHALFKRLAREEREDLYQEIVYQTWKSFEYFKKASKTAHNLKPSTCRK